VGFKAGRSEAIFKEVTEKVILESGNDDIHFLKLDLASLDSVKEAAEELKRVNVPIHYLFNNAGTFRQNYEETKDGLEVMFRNHLHFQLSTF
jgi:retinol dehydrogenase-12